MIWVVQINGNCGKSNRLWSLNYSKLKKVYQIEYSGWIGEDEFGRFVTMREIKMISNKDTRIFTKSPGVSVFCLPEIRWVVGAGAALDHGGRCALVTEITLARAHPSQWGCNTTIITTWELTIPIIVSVRQPRSHRLSLGFVWKYVLVRKWQNFIK